MFHRRWKYLQRAARDFFQKMCFSWLFGTTSSVSIHLNTSTVVDKVGFYLSHIELPMVEDTSCNRTLLSTIAAHQSPMSRIHQASFERATPDFRFALRRPLQCPLWNIQFLVAQSST